MSTLKVNNVQDLGADAVVTNGVVNASALPAGSILQVVSATKTDTSSSTSGSYADVSGLSVSITPSSTSSKILVIASVILGHTITNGGITYAQVVRDSTAIGNAATNASMVYGGVATVNSVQWDVSANSFNYLDSPATTSATTYKVQFNRGSASGTAYVNRSGHTTDVAGSSHITVMEVAG